MRPIVLALCLLACSKHDRSSPPPAAKEVAPATPPLPLHVTADGRTVAMTSAVLVHRTDDVLQLTVANHALRCEDAVNNERWGVPEDDISFDAQITSPIRPDGTRPFVLSHVGVVSVPDTRVEIRGDLDKAPEIQLAFSVDAGTGVDHWKHLDVTGAVKPIVCARPPTPASPHPSTAVLTIAGQSIAIASARWRDGKAELSSEPGGCAVQATAPPRATLSIAPSGWQLEGGWVGSGLIGSAGLHVATGTRGTSPDGKTVVLKLSGTSTIAGYKIDVAGTIEALDCPAS